MTTESVATVPEDLDKPSELRLFLQNVLNGLNETLEANEQLTERIAALEASNAELTTILDNVAVKLTSAEEAIREL